jgi:2-oxoglutarate ferredoxin oxidoreductase subunit gamma
MKKEVYRIIFAGEGGQGVQSLAHAYTKAAFEAGLHVAYMPNYGVEQRGGVSLGYLQFGKGTIGFPKFQKADILVVLCKRAIDRTLTYIGDQTVYIYDSSQIKSSDLAGVFAEKLAIPATETATKKLEPKVFNMILAGAILPEIEGITEKDLEKAFSFIFAKKYKEKPQLKHLNEKALKLGVALSKEAYQNI